MSKVDSIHNTMEVTKNDIARLYESVTNARRALDQIKSGQAVHLKVSVARSNDIWFEIPSGSKMMEEVISFISNRVVTSEEAINKLAMELGIALIKMNGVAE